MADWEAYHEGAPLARSTLCGYVTLVPIYDLPTDGQADAYALIFAAAVQPLEGYEDPIQVFFLKSDAVVLHSDFTKVELMTLVWIVYFRCPFGWRPYLDMRNIFFVLEFQAV